MDEVAVEVVLVTEWTNGDAFCNDDGACEMVMAVAVATVAGAAGIPVVPALFLYRRL